MLDSLHVCMCTVACRLYGVNVYYLSRYLVLLPLEVAQVRAWCMRRPVQLQGTGLEKLSYRPRTKGACQATAP